MVWLVQRPTFFVLAGLLDGPAHGYAIIGRAAELSGHQVRLTAGTLYGALERLEAEELVEATGEEVVGGRRRRYYRLTGAGRAAVTAEARRMDAAARSVLSHRALGGPTAATS